ELRGTRLGRLADIQQLTLGADAGRVSEQLARLGISGGTRVRVVVEVIEQEMPPMSALAQEGGAFEFLAEEPDIYTDDDLIERNPSVRVRRNRPDPISSYRFLWEKRRPTRVVRTTGVTLL